MIAACLLVLLPGVSSGADRVLIIENTSSPTSVEVASDYAQKRGVKNTLKVQCQDSALSATNETLPYATLVDSIQKPLKAYLKQNPKIDFIVLTKGIPIRLTDAPFGMANKQPSLDSAIACFGYEDRKDVESIVLNDSGFTGKCWVNRFWNSKERFSHAKFGMYLVNRLTGYSVEDCFKLIDNSINSKPSKAPILIDSQPKFVKGSAYWGMEVSMARASEYLKAKNLNVNFDRSEAFANGDEALAGYCSWGSNDANFDLAAYHQLTFVPGAIAETFVSTSGRTFEPTSGGQSLIADLIAQGVTGVKGYVSEPFTFALCESGILFDRYTNGFNLAESFYAATPLVKWKDIVVGDPLCRPYKK